MSETTCTNELATASDAGLESAQATAKISKNKVTITLSRTVWGMLLTALIGAGSTGGVMHLSSSKQEPATGSVSQEDFRAWAEEHSSSHLLNDERLRAAFKEERKVAKEDRREEVKAQREYFDLKFDALDSDIRDLKRAQRTR